MSKYRDLESIAHDLATSLSSYIGAYTGSPYKDQAELLLREYQDFLSHWRGISDQKIDCWDTLEVRIMTLLSDDNMSLSDVREKAQEIVETVKCFHPIAHKGKLEEAIKILQTLNEN